MKLNFWCWFDIKEWYINMDKIKNPWVDIVHNFEVVPLPFDDNTFDEIYTCMVLEHIINLTDVIDEFVRISKNWAQIKITVPYFSSTNLWGDPTHVRGFNSNTFSAFHSNSLKSHGNIKLTKFKIHFLSNPQFMKSVPLNVIPDFFINLFPKIYERVFPYIFPSSEIHFLLEIKK